MRFIPPATVLPDDGDRSIPSSPGHCLKASALSCLQLRKPSIFKRIGPSGVIHRSFKFRDQDGGIVELTQFSVEPETENILRTLFHPVNMGAPFGF